MARPLRPPHPYSAAAKAFREAASEITSGSGDHYAYLDECQAALDGLKWPLEDWVADGYCVCVRKSARGQDGHDLGNGLTWAIVYLAGWFSAQANAIKSPQVPTTPSRKPNRAATGAGLRA